VAGAQHLLAALRHLRAEQRGMGLSGKMDGRGNSYARHINEEARKKNELAFCRVCEREKARKSTRCRSISGNSWHLFQVGHSK
jgi:hypothetical protein